MSQELKRYKQVLMSMVPAVDGEWIHYSTAADLQRSHEDLARSLKEVLEYATIGDDDGPGSAGVAARARAALSEFDQLTK